ncbi:hypothetical protein H6F88_31540 [Oculatella sp. FACHB-28]|uniref:hypothetical protein n=1 Tax=Oculatella sp. FACHB-28 TaxID=2692845 RepID=UPI0016886199|nr:hypothetical protein [Oculatella sp. FACHB-28]MBD2060478.1 hypothetical protein [Oculatella sp. FACHB-28]
MSYQNRLNPWLVVRLLPTMQQIVVGRFRNWSNADGHRKTLKQLIPQAEFSVVFDPSDPM